MNEDFLLNEPKLNDIPKHKLEFLQKLFYESKTKSQAELLPFLLSLVKMSKDKNISFSDTEIDKIISVIKENSTSEELNKINYILQKYKQR